MKAHRSILSVPGHVLKMHEKAADSLADVIMLDLEDSVPQDAKEAARRQVVESLAAIDWRAKVVTVRINSLDTPLAYRDLVDGAVLGPLAAARFVLPLGRRHDRRCADRVLWCRFSRFGNAMAPPYGFEARSKPVSAPGV